MTNIKSFELKLKNFKCYNEKTFNFNGNGVYMLKGCSGVGKSTILDAFIFVFYGKGTNLPNYENENKSSLVSLTLNIQTSNNEKKSEEKKQIRLIRSTKPKKLLVSYNEYIYDNEKDNIINLEGDAAQSFIEQNLLASQDYEDFLISSVSRQTNKHESFLSLTQSEQLKFIQKHISTSSTSENKEKLESLIYTINEEKKTINTKIDMKKEHLFSYENNFSDEEKDKYQQLQASNNIFEEIDTIIKNINEEYKLLEDKNKDNEYQISNIKNKQVQSTKTNQKEVTQEINMINKSKERIQELKNSLFELDTKINSLPKVFTEQELKNLENIKQKIENRIKFIDITSKIEKLEDDKTILHETLKESIQLKLNELQLKNINDEEYNYNETTYKICEERYTEYNNQYEQKQKSEKKILSELEKIINILKSKGIKDFRTKTQTLTTSNKKLNEILENAKNSLSKLNTTEEELIKEKIEIEILKKQEEQKKDIKDKNKNKKYKCPNCSCVLTINNTSDTLLIDNDNTEKEIQDEINTNTNTNIYDEKYENIIQKLNNIKQQKKEIEQIIKDTDNYFSIFTSESDNLNLQVTKKMVDESLNSYNQIKIKYEESKNIRNELEKLNKELDNINKSKSVLSFEKELENLIKSKKELLNTIAIFNKNIPENNISIEKGDEEEKINLSIEHKKIQEQVKTNYENSNKYEILKKNYEKLSNEFVLILEKNKISYTSTTQETSYFISEFNKKIEECNNIINALIIREKELSDKILLLTEEQNKNYIILQNIQKNIVNYEKLKDYEKVKIDYNALLLEDTEKEKILNKAQKLKSIIKKAEILSTEKFIDIVNNNIANFIDFLFNQNEKLNIELSTNKELKNKDSKIELSFSIHHKEKELTNLNNFSTGEYARIDLSFLLAFNNLFNSKFLFIDESLSFLDEELIISIVNMLKEDYSDKLIIIVSHIINIGIFDDVIEL